MQAGRRIIKEKKVIWERPDKSVNLGYA